MPPRHVTWAVVAFWLATSAWLIHRDVWPRLVPGEPTLFDIDLTDEARIDLAANPRVAIGRISWSLKQNDQDVGRSETGIRYHTPEDPFELYGQLRVNPPDPVAGAPLLFIDSSYRVGWEGQCREFSAQVQLPDRSVPKLHRTVFVHLEGLWRDRQWSLSRQPIPFEENRIPVSETEALSDRGNLLNLLHPLNRMPGLSLGQHWNVPIVDVLAAAVPGEPTAPLRRVEGSVEEETLRRQQHRQVPCWVVTYARDGELQGRTWVRKSDGLVLMQEMRVLFDLGVLKPGDRLIFDRDADY